MATKKRIIPDASKFRIVAESAASDVLFGGKRRESVYLKALQDLLATPNTVMEVDSPTARGGITAQAKKAGITVLFGEARGKLYVKVMGKASAEELVLEHLAKRPMPINEIAELLAHPYPDVKAKDIMATLSQSSKAQLRSRPGSEEKLWHAI